MGEGRVGQEGAWERPWGPPTSLFGNHEVPDGVGRKGLGCGARRSRDAAGTRTPAQQCQVCHHQRLLLFPARFLTDSKVKSKT